MKQEINTKSNAESNAANRLLVTVIQDHPGEGAFPNFPKGMRVHLADEECQHFIHWYPCIIEGHETYIPESFVTDGRLNREYNPTELVQQAGDELEVLEIINAWLVAKNANGKIGWIPAESVSSKRS